MKNKKQKKIETENTLKSLDSIINDALKNIKTIVDVSTIVGEEVKTTDGTTIIPISKVIVGFVAGGAELHPKKADKKANVSSAYPFSGGTGAGFTVVPIGFLTGKDGKLEFVSAKSDTKFDELISLTNKGLKIVIDNFSNRNGYAEKVTTNETVTNQGKTESKEKVVKKSSNTTKSNKPKNNINKTNSKTKK